MLVYDRAVVTSRYVLYAIVCGSPAARHVGRLVDGAQRAGWDVCVVSTPDGAHVPVTVLVTDGSRAVVDGVVVGQQILTVSREGGTS